MKIKVKDVTLEIRNIDNARLRDLAELQTQSGMKLPEIRKSRRARIGSRPAILTFLSMRGACHAFTWDDALELTNDDIKVLVEPGDVRAQEIEEADPQSPSGASVPDGDEPEAKPRPAALPRKQRSHGSTSK